MAQSVTLSSAGTATIILNPVSRTTSVVLTNTLGSSQSVVQIEVTLDDPTTTPAPTLAWALLSSASAMTSSTALSLLYTVTSPIGGVRLNSSGLIGSSTVFTLKALQSVIS
jgi:hypothetical protein